MPTRCNRGSIADLIACSTSFGHHYAHHQELKSIIQWLLRVVFRAVVFKLLVWCGAEGYVSGLQDAAQFTKLNRDTQNIQPYIRYKIEPKEYERSSKLHMICISSNNNRHPVPKTFIPLHYTYRHLTSSHLNFTQLHFTTFLFSLTRSISPHFTTLHLISLHRTLRRFLRHFFLVFPPLLSFLQWHVLEDSP